MAGLNGALNQIEAFDDSRSWLEQVLDATSFPETNRGNVLPSARNIDLNVNFEEERQILPLFPLRNFVDSTQASISDQDTCNELLYKAGSGSGSTKSEKNREVFRGLNFFSLATPMLDECPRPKMFSTHFIPNIHSFSEPVDSVAYLQPLSRVNNISVEIPDDLIRENLYLFAEAVATNNVAKIKYIGTMLGTQSKQDGRPLQRLLHMCMTGLHLKMNFELEMRTTKPLLFSPLDVQHTFAKLASKTPFVPIGFESSFRSIFESVEGYERIHIIDFGSWPQHWVVFLKKLAAKPEKPPFVRITIVLTASSSSFTKIDFPKMATELNSTALQLHIPLEVSAVRLFKEHIHSGMFRCEEGEAVVVNSTMYLHELPDSSVLRFNPRDKLIAAIHDLNPVLFRVMDFNVDLNTNFFLARFKNLVRFYESFFSAVERSFDGEMDATRIIESALLQEQIMNVISCEGLKRWFRPESVTQMIARFQNLGFSVRPYSLETMQALEAMMAAYPSYRLRYTDGYAELVSNHDNVPCLVFIAWRVMN